MFKPLQSLIGILAIVLLCLPAEAGLFKRKSKEPDAAAQIRTFQPPPPNAMEQECEPFRRKAALLSQAPLWQKPFVLPQRSLAISRHRKCTANLMMQEREYLKHVDIQRSPSLPKLKLEEQTKPEPSHADRP